MIHLLNSAMMPQPGHYKMESLEPRQFAEYMLRAHKKGELKSYIGYGSTAKILTELAGIYIPTGRAQTQLSDGDVMLIARLKYRVQEAGFKKTDAVNPTIDDLEFFICTYKNAP
jgi:hypothetical protein